MQLRYFRKSLPLSGFTLIELSIVLVIIGLIIGGVLVGRDLISASEVRAQIAQIEKYNSAVNTFSSKYGGLPGDLNIPLANQFGFAIGSGCTGAQGGRDGNGLIDGATGVVLAAIMGENAFFWVDLSTANLIDAEFPANTAYGGGCSGGNGLPSCACALSLTTVGGANGIGNYLPAAKIGRGNFVHVYETKGYNWYDVSAITASVGGSSVITANTTIPVIQAYNIDKKVDDGVPTTGTVVATYINGSQTVTSAAPNGATDTASTCYSGSGNTYNYSISASANQGAGLNCALSFRFQ